MNSAIYRSRRAFFVLCGAAALLYPSLLAAAGFGREALSSFPDDTLQIAFTNLAELRISPVYPQIKQRLLSRQFRDFLDFLRSTGMDPEKDVDEVVLGWRGSPADSANFFGVASGRFEPQRAHEFFEKSQLPSRQYSGADLYAFGSGQSGADLYFTFLSSSSAAFGRWSDVAAVLDAHSGARAALDSNANLVSWEAELEGTSPQWGILTGRAAANLAAPWLTTGGAKPAADPSVLLGPVEAVLYRADWGSGFSAHLSILCQSVESADALAKVLTLWRDVQRATVAGAGSAGPPPLPNLDVQTANSRVEMTATGPLETLDQLLHIH